MSELTGDVCWICGARPVDAAAAPVLAFPPSLCAHCGGTLTRPCDQAWQALLKYLHANWKDITRRGSFDLSRAFGGDAASGALKAHLYFVKVLGAKLRTDAVNVDLSGLSSALLHGTPHPEVTLLLADCSPEGRALRYYDAAVSVLKRDEAVYSAVWMHLAFPVAVKICYLDADAPVLEPEGFPWHPTRQRKIVKLSPYKGDTRSIHARRDLRM